MVENKSLTHKQLVNLGERFLRNRSKDFWILTEPGFRRELPDVIGLHKYNTTVIECKASRSDFLADQKKIFRIHPELGLGVYRIYLTNIGIINESELPPGWQLMEAIDENTILLPYDGISTSSFGKEAHKFKIRNFEAENDLFWSYVYRQEHDLLSKTDNKKIFFRQKPDPCSVCKTKTCQLSDDKKYCSHLYKSRKEFDKDYQESVSALSCLENTKVVSAKDTESFKKSLEKEIIPDPTDDVALGYNSGIKTALKKADEFLRAEDISFYKDLLLSQNP